VIFDEGTSVVPKILSLRSYSKGYTGFIEERDRYTFFQFSRNGELTEIMEFDKSDYKDYGHFLGGITKFFPLNFFLKEPITVESISITDLDRIFDLAPDSREGGDKLRDGE
jgi:hypothetical protein